MRHRYISYFAGIFLLAFFAVLKTADFQEKSHLPDFRSCTANGETKRAGMLMCNHAGQSGMM